MSRALNENDKKIIKENIEKSVGYKYQAHAKHVTTYVLYKHLRKSSGDKHDFIGQKLLQMGEK